MFVQVANLGTCFDLISEMPIQMDFENFEYPDSPTQKWLADNADLSPLTVLDNINLKTEFPCAPGAAGQGRWRTEFDRARNGSIILIPISKHKLDHYMSQSGSII